MTRRSKLTGKRMLIMVFAIVLLCVAPLSAFAAKKEAATVAHGVSITINGELVKLSEPARMLDNRLFLPVALIAELLQATTKWDKTNQEVTIHNAYGDKMVFGIGVPVVYFNEGRYRMDTTPFILDGRTYIPLRHVAEVLHAEIDWNEDNRQAELSMVERAEVTEEFGLAEISKEYGVSKSDLLQRNGLDSEDSIEAGAMLRVVMPSILDNKAAAFTEEDLRLLAKITMVEAGYESYEGQLGVANVILNRVKDSRFPSTIRDVIYSGKQFPPAHNGLLDKSVPNASVLRAAKDALNGKNNVEKAVYFFNPKVSKGKFWDSLKVIETFGHHSFAK